MAQVYQFVDANGETRLFAEITPDPAGTPFNGGTITNGLEIDNPSNSTNALTIKEQLGGTVDTIGPGGELHVAANYSQANDVWALRVDPGDNSGARGLEVRNQAGAAAVWYTDNAGDIASSAITIGFSAGIVFIAARADGQTPLTLTAHAATDSALVVNKHATTNVVFAVADDGSYRTQAHAAPADGSLVVGEMAVWFDQTNGAAKLMVKAKQADGTVRTGSLALA